MLHHFKSYYYTHSDHYHLGDIINIIQQIHHKALNTGIHFVFGRKCPCCNVNSGNMMKTILSLLDTPVKYGINQKFIIISPSWTKIHSANIYDWKYAKAKKLPKKGDHIVCQFDQRSVGNKTPKNILDFVKPNMINIGDRKLPCMNQNELGLIEKFNILASASKYIGIDSGLTHLALMTEVPIVLVHPKEWDAKKYYPKTDQISFVEV